MKNIFYFLLIVFPVLALAQSEDENYIQSWTYTGETTTPNQTGISVITYYDGIGRPKQVINLKAGYWNQNQFTPITYDGFGRQTKKYLSFAATGSIYFPPNYMDNDDLISMINNKYSAELLSTNPNPYSETIIENSPLNRPLEQGAPGASWLANPNSDSDHTIKYDYQTNGLNEVRKFNVTFPVATSTETTALRTINFYPPDRLYKKITKDENWIPADGKDKTVEEFTDKQGRVVLKRSYNDGVPHDTHYVYDKFFNLTYVIPPLAADNVYYRQFTNDFQNTNFPWTWLASVDGNLADAYERKIADYDNSEILNLDLLSEYSGQGGFSITPDENNNLILNINITTSDPMPYRTGQILSLKKFGIFADKELGRIRGDGYEYFFMIRNNAIEVDGYGKVPSLTRSFNGDTPLDYQYNYPWTKILKADANIAKEYEQNIKGLPNSEILTTYTANPYQAAGGISVSLDEDDTINLSININTETPLELLRGALMSFDFKRTVADRDFGSVSGPGYNYTFSLKGGRLYVNGSGLINHLTFSGSFGRTRDVIDQQVVDGLCYIYHYDKWNRMIEKHIPGKGWEHIVYDKMNRPVFTQDEKQRAKPAGEANWLFTKYDAFGRVIYTGEFYDARNRKSLQDYINGLQGDVMHETHILGEFSHNGIKVDYTNTIFPTNIKVFTVNYYDDYRFTHVGLPAEPTLNYYGKQLTKYPRGLQTGSKVRVLGTNNWVTSVIGYDIKGRQIWSESKNGALNSQTITHTDLNFSNLPTATRTEHKKNSTGFIVNVEDMFTYDNMNRLKDHTQKINNGPVELITHNVVDELGRLSRKRVGDVYDSGTSYDFFGALQSIDYRYNIRGWLTAINDVGDDLASGSVEDLFALRLDYNTTTYSSTQALYNGNICEISWKTKNDGKLRTYGFTYDDLNRLTAADVLSSNTYTASPYTGQPENYKEGPITYDKNGNIKSLERWGLNSSNVTDKIDVLTYTYYSKSNQLLKVTDSALEDIGFDNGDSGSGNDYEYDENGNMDTDRNKGIGMVAAEKITYNHLNLPEKITFDQTHYIEYDYDAKGSKIQKKVTNGTNVTTTQYDNGFVYQGNVLQYFPHDEGYVERQSNGNYSYIYQYKDHLGNIRLSYKKNTSGSLQILSENNYYPFGLKHNGYNNTVLSTNIAQKYKYNGKELQDELGLNMYDYGTRNYDPALGRWFAVDPKAEEMRRFSPYTYVYNNPVYFIDPDGMKGEDWFVNSKTGAVVYFKGKSKITQKEADKQGLGNVSNWNNLGADNMFGDQVSYGSDNNILDNDFVMIEGDPGSFMKKQGYEKAEKVNIKETLITSGGAMGADENITQVDASLKQLGDSEITYTTSNNLNVKDRIETTKYTEGKWNSIETTTYELTKPYGQSNSKTSMYAPQASESKEISIYQIIGDLFKQAIENDQLPNSY